MSFSLPLEFCANLLFLRCAIGSISTNIMRIYKRGCSFKLAFLRTQRHMLMCAHHKHTTYASIKAHINMELTRFHTHTQGERARERENPSAWNKQNGWMPFGSPGKWILLTEQLASLRQGNLYSIHPLYYSQPSFLLHVTPHLLVGFGMAVQALFWGTAWRVWRTVWSWDPEERVRCLMWWNRCSQPERAAQPEPVG